MAVEGVDAPSRWIVLFTTLDISLQQANAVLAAAGLRGVMRLDAVERIEAIPVLGTGKTDYKVLRKLVAEKPAKASREPPKNSDQGCTSSLARNVW